ncbi:MAG: hypothetical protein MUW51_00685 [Lactococcus lactis]|nr:hypothetical protein [Lactococcus lactis]
MGKQILLASLYLSEKISEDLIFFQHKLAEISNTMVDVYEEYKRIDRKYINRLENDMEANMFYWEYSQICRGKKIQEKADWLDGIGSKKISDLKKVLKNTILSEE